MKLVAASRKIGVGAPVHSSAIDPTLVEALHSELETVLAWFGEIQRGELEGNHRVTMIEDDRGLSRKFGELHRLIQFIECRDRHRRNMRVLLDIFAPEDIETLGSTEEQVSIGINEISALIEIVVLEPVWRTKTLDIPCDGVDP